MTSKTIVYAILDPKIPTYGQLSGWRGFAKKYLRIPFRAPYLVLSISNDTIVFNPANLRVVREIMAKHNPQVEIVVRNPVSAVT